MLLESLSLLMIVPETVPQCNAVRYGLRRPKRVFQSSILECNTNTNRSDGEYMRYLHHSSQTGSDLRFLSWSEKIHLDAELGFDFECIKRTDKS